MLGSTSDGTHTELYVRSLAQRGALQRQDDVIRTLDELEDLGVLEDHTVHVCGKHVPAVPAETQTDFGSHVRHRLVSFQEWADRNGWSLGSLLETRTLESNITGESKEVIVLPTMLLAEYEGSELQFVSPCSNPERNWSIEDRLRRLEATGTGESEQHSQPPQRSSEGGRGLEL